VWILDLLGIADVDFFRAKELVCVIDGLKLTAMLL
jgi:hypothetical protein